MRCIDLLMSQNHRCPRDVHAIFLYKKTERKFAISATCSTSTRISEKRLTNLTMGAHTTCSSEEIYEERRF